MCKCGMVALSEKKNPYSLIQVHTVLDDKSQGGKVLKRVNKESLS